MAVAITKSGVVYYFPWLLIDIIICGSEIFVSYDTTFCLFVRRNVALRHPAHTPHPAYTSSRLPGSQIQYFKLGWAKYTLTMPLVTMIAMLDGIIGVQIPWIKIT